jgi:predicted double-glycine peptidase
MHAVPRFRIAVKVTCLALAFGLALIDKPLADSARPVTSLSEMRHANVVLQQWDLSCAAAALATILRYQYGIPITERAVALGLVDRAEYIANPELIRLREGFSLLDLKRYTDAIGYEGVGLGQLAFRDLLERAPIIVPVNLRGYPHFVVFRGATSREVLLADPSFGNVAMSIDKFLNAWIDYRDIGRVGFVVTKSGAVAPPGLLAARSTHFLVIR